VIVAAVPGVAVADEVGSHDIGFILT